jgi:hypothetical protein
MGPAGPEGPAPINILFEIYFLADFFTIFANLVLNISALITFL